MRLPMEIVGDSRTAAPGETRNVSSCGVLFASKQTVGVGDTIEYLITLPKAPGAKINVRLRCMGTVVRNAEATQFAATMDRYEFLRERD